MTENRPAYNPGLAKVAAQCSADTFMVNQSLVLRINICGENRHLRQARNRCIQYIFRTYAESFSPIFSKKFIEIVTEKSCAKIENRTNFVDKLCVEITFSGKFAVKLKPETKRFVKICCA